ncbi:uncharacterized protein THITE_117610 [Thermothielavioides terrestris NRRL 8126]|uniref:Uncharacterized protein n=1 Tax=Thermothielavioides terrestris (strain ATCC 38088 / NRRL 8126) TaxID=578455 RepID=G2R848_THETT|nr:uncharacterized protein THITE_117610 [Thermothielavioides terrestris NRRL 8126]AEO68107.1 hypothetical protein THITE_117610 [Thermothielavioides terrestris NRRL 8126]
MGNSTSRPRKPKTRGQLSRTNPKLSAEAALQQRISLNRATLDKFLQQIGHPNRGRTRDSLIRLAQQQRLSQIPPSTPSHGRSSQTPMRETTTPLNTTNNPQPSSADPRSPTPTAAAFPQRDKPLPPLPFPTPPLSCASTSSFGPSQVAYHQYQDEHRYQHQHHLSTHHLARDVHIAHHRAAALRRLEQSSPPSSEDDTERGVAIDTGTCAGTLPRGGSGRGHGSGSGLGACHTPRQEDVLSLQRMSPATVYDRSRSRVPEVILRRIERDWNRERERERRAAVS